MHSRARAALLAIVMAAAVVACGVPNPLGRDYEYEEDLTLSIDGSATLVVNSSVLALDVLKGMSLNPDVAARTDQLRDQVRAAYESRYATVGRISTWTRRGRRFVGIHLTVPDIRVLPKAAPFAGRTYELRPDGETVTFRETLAKEMLIGLSAKTPAPRVSLSAWRGDEIVGYRLHLPARIRYQNSRYLEGTRESRPASRGNIVTWEQRLSERLEGKPIAYAEDTTPDVMEVRMDRESILYRTLWLFGIAFAAALLVLATLIWLTMRKGREASVSVARHEGPRRSSDF